MLTRRKHLRGIKKYSARLSNQIYQLGKQDLRLKDETGVMIDAGSDTIKYTLTTTSYYILDNPKTERELVDGLVKAMPEGDSTLTWAELETLRLDCCSSGGSVFFVLT